MDDNSLEGPPPNGPHSSEYLSEDESQEFVEIPCDPSHHCLVRTLGEFRSAKDEGEAIDKDNNDNEEQKNLFHSVLRLLGQDLEKLPELNCICLHFWNQTVAVLRNHMNRILGTRLENPLVIIRSPV